MELDNDRIPVLIFSVISLESNKQYNDNSLPVALSRKHIVVECTGVLYEKYALWTFTGIEYCTSTEDCSTLYYLYYFISLTMLRTES